MAIHHKGFVGALLGVCLGLGVGSLDARAQDYRLNAGDTLTFSVPSLNIERKATVGPNRKVAIPMMGNVDITDKTIEELQAIVKQTLPTKVFSQRLSDGREVGTVIAAEEISLSISEFRPVYTMGDVQSPGERAFRPGMIVEQLVSMAGGLSLSQMRLENPYLNFADLRSDYDGVWSDVVRLRSRINWLRKTLQMPAAPEDVTSQKSPLPDTVLKTINDLQEKELNARGQRIAKEREDLDQLVQSSRDRITVIDKQSIKEEEGAKFDASEEQRINDLVRSGNAAANRASEIRRIGLLSATRVLQIQVQSEAERKTLAEYMRQIGVLDREYQAALSTDLQSTYSEYSKSRSKRESIWEKMLYTGAIKMSLASGDPQQVKFSINRDTGSGRKIVEADASTELQPGDVVQVQLKLGQASRTQ